jgi:hypothetical protein
MSPFEVIQIEFDQWSNALPWTDGSWPVHCGQLAHFELKEGVEFYCSCGARISDEELSGLSFSTADLTLKVLTGPAA